MKYRVPIHAYRLRYLDSPHAPEMLWEWERPSIDRLLWNAKTFGRGIVQRYFSTWDVFAQENERIWETHYLPRPLYEPWESWRAWLDEYREIVRDVQDIAEECYGRTHQDPLQARQRALVSAKSGGFPLSKAVGRECSNAFLTPMPLHPLGQMCRHRRLFPQWPFRHGDLGKIHA
jgi:hypothetical protein